MADENSSITDGLDTVFVSVFVERNILGDFAASCINRDQMERRGSVTYGISGTVIYAVVAFFAEQVHEGCVISVGVIVAFT